MKLRNKRTGVIKRVVFLSDYQTDDGTEIGFRVADTLDVYSYKSLAELNEEWEDYEEQEVWFVSNNGQIHEEDGHDRYRRERQSIGNYFETREEAEKAVEKLKAWKRLKDKGFRFIDHLDRDSGQGMTRYEWDGYIDGEDLDLLFGGEE